MKKLLPLVFAFALSATFITGCASAEEKLAQKGCDCFANEDKAAIGECLDKMAVDEPRLKDDREFGKKIESMIKEKCPDAAKAY